MPGFAAIFAALVATGIAGFCFLNTYLAAATRRSQPGAAAYGPLFYRVAAALIAAAAVYLYYLIFTDNFSFAYVFGYSSRDLDPAYKLSAFWAGQEGSFLLWVVFHAAFGLMLARRGMPAAMAVYCGLQIMLLTALLAKSPFMAISPPQPDGAGLNPLLQDPWMVIHPPVVFLGYALLAVPFATAMEALLTGRHKAWVKEAAPWTLAAWCTLGAGIFIGGYWAYKVLGWGGYWAWDPVENASLIPWLACGALLHLLVLARVREAAVKPAYFAAIISFVLVMYATFLTRSGLLSDFSTHAFADEGLGGLLASFIFVTVSAGLILLILRWPKLPSGELIPSAGSREFFLTATAMAFAAIGLIVLVGTSTPMVTKLLGQPQSVGAVFYNTTTLPLTALMALLLAVGSFFGWGRDGGALFRRYRWALLLVAAHFTGLAAWYGLGGAVSALTVGLAAAAGAASLLAAGHKRITLPAAATHCGVAVLLIGIVVSSAGSRSVTVTLEPGAAKPLFGTTITYLGDEQEAGGKGFYEKFRVGADIVQPYTKLNKEGKPAAREPGILRSLTGDLYVAPAARQEANSYQELIIRKGETVNKDNLAIGLIRFGMVGGTGGEVRVYALLTAADGGKTEEVKAELVSRGGQVVPVPVKTLDRYELVLSAVSVSEGKAEFGVRDLRAPNNAGINVEVSRKPLINLVWLGTVLITVGLGWAFHAGNRRPADGASRSGGPPSVP